MISTRLRTQNMFSLVFIEKMREFLSEIAEFVVLLTFIWYLATDCRYKTPKPIRSLAVIFIMCSRCTIPYYCWTLYEVILMHFSRTIPAQPIKSMWANKNIHKYHIPRRFTHRCGIYSKWRQCAHLNWSAESL